jgi:hypothetical protein
MTVLVVDTNVIAVANKLHNGVCTNCIKTCIQRLLEIQREGCVAIDSAWEILSEYLGYANPNRQKEVGDVFLKWLLQNRANVTRCSQVAIVAHSCRGYESFPEDERLTNFDAPDRKFVAVSAAHALRPAILQATDSKWLDWITALRDHGVEVVLVCEEDIRRFHTTGKKP